MAKGANIKKVKAKARVDIAKKSALVAIDTPNAPLNPKPFQADNIDNAVSELGVKFKVNLQKMDGTKSKEELNMNSLDTFEEADLVAKSAALSEQQRQMDFLHEFQNQLGDDNFRAELKELLQSEKKDKLLAFLKGWSKKLKKPDSQFLDLLRAGS